MQDPKTWYAAVSVANVWPTKAPSFSAELWTQRGRPEVGQDRIEILRLHRRRGLMEVTWSKKYHQWLGLWNISYLTPPKKHGGKSPRNIDIYILYNPVNPTGGSLGGFTKKPMTRAWDSENWWTAQLEWKWERYRDMTNWSICHVDWVVFVHMFSS